MGKLTDLTGKTFGQWTVLNRAPNAGKNTRWLCRCSCEGEYPVHAGNLVTGGSVMCALCADKVGAVKRQSHGAANRGEILPEYNAWRGMKNRCYNPKEKWFDNYGGRGITVCPAWINDFSAFFEHIGPRPGPGYTVDRIRVNGNYEPGNVRWATVREQNLNQRRTHMVTVDGITDTLSHTCERFGLPYMAVYQRIFHSKPKRAAQDVFDALRY